MPYGNTGRYHLACIPAFALGAHAFVRGAHTSAWTRRGTVHTRLVAGKPRSYVDKRDPTRTNEPFGDGEREGASTLHGAFVVHLHDATRSHYDLRIEANGVLASFAVPKGPCLDPDEKRLAIHTEDHPLEYLDFEEVIPEGNYGGGPMIVWDRGSVKYLEGPSERGIVDGKVDMMFYGRKLRGRWALVKLGARAGAPRTGTEARAWLFFKKKDAYASTEEDITKRDRSVLSGLAIGELESREALGASLVARAAALGVERAPCLAFASVRDRDTLPEGKTVAYELELDGVHARLEKDDVSVRIVEKGDASRRDLADFYPEIVRAARALAAPELVIEGTIVTFDPNGAPSLGMLAARAAKIAGGDLHTAMLDAPVTFVAEDLLALGGYALDEAKLSARRGLLEAAVVGEGIVRTSELLPGPAKRARDLALALGVRRLRAKRLDAPYLGPGGGEAASTRLALGPSTDLSRVEHGSLRAQVREVRVTNPSKIYFPEKGIEKGRVVGYYRAVSGALLPHVSGRPVTVERFPDGIHGKHFFQWNVPPQMPAWMRTLAFKDEVEGRTKRGFLIDDVASLLYVANLGSIPIHVFSCRAESLAVCNYVAIDFDVKLSSLRVAVTLAHTLRGILDAIGLRGFPKTSGQTGLHVLVPLGEGHGYDTARALVELLGRLLVHAHPDLATMERSPAKRGPKVYVDTVQTGPTRSLAAAYSLRAVPEATVSTPLEWSDVVPDLDPRAFTLETVPKLVESRVCPMEGFFRVAPDVPTAVRKLAEVWGRST